MHISGRNLNNIKTAVSQRALVIECSMDDALVVKTSDENPFGEDVRMIHRRKLKPELLTHAEKDDVVAKYESGMTMTAVAALYGCHYTTVGEILRKRGTAIRP